MSVPQQSVNPQDHNQEMHLCISPLEYPFSSAASFPSILCKTCRSQPHTSKHYKTWHRTQLRRGGIWDDNHNKNGFWIKQKTQHCMNMVSDNSYENTSFNWVRLVCISISNVSLPMVSYIIEKLFKYVRTINWRRSDSCKRHSRIKAEVN